MDKNPLLNSTLKINVLRNANDFHQNLDNDEFLICLIFNGEALLNCKDKSYTLKSDRIFIYSQPHRLSNLNVYSPFYGLSIKLDINFLHRFFLFMNYNPSLHKGNYLSKGDSLLVNNYEEISLLMESIRRYNNSNLLHENKAFLECKLFELLWLINKYNKKQFNEFIQPFLVPNKTLLDSLLESCYKENIAIKDLAMMAGFSVSTFKRKFRKIYDCSPGKWIQNRKLQEAKYILETTDKTMSEITYDAGFKNPSYFNQLFKSKFGITPKKMKQNLNKTAA